jgi:hypothetical protein
MPALRGGGQDFRARAHRCLETRDIVAERRTEAARLQKIRLHIDDDECHPAGIDGERLRLRRYGPHWQGGLSLLLVPRVTRAYFGHPRI